MAMCVVETYCGWQRRCVVRSKPGDRVIFVCHYPLDHDLSNSGEILSILHNYPVVLTLAGHYHTLKLLNVDGIGGFIGRSISLRHSESDKPGYNILEVGADGAKLYNKELGEPLPDTPDYEFKFGKVSAIRQRRRWFCLSLSRGNSGRDGADNGVASCVIQRYSGKRGGGDNSYRK